jgi:hypothetical protein
MLIRVISEFWADDAPLVHRRMDPTSPFTARSDQGGFTLSSGSLFNAARRGGGGFCLNLLRLTRVDWVQAVAPRLERYLRGSDEGRRAFHFSISKRRARGDADVALETAFLAYLDREGKARRVARRSAGSSAGPDRSAGQRCRGCLRGARRELREGDRVLIQEPGELSSEGGRTIIRHSDVDRFRWHASDVRVERRGADTDKVSLPNTPSDQPWKVPVINIAQTDFWVVVQPVATVLSGRSDHG